MQINLILNIGASFGQDQGVVVQNVEPSFSSRGKGRGGYEYLDIWKFCPHASLMGPQMMGSRDLGKLGLQKSCLVFQVLFSVEFPQHSIVHIFDKHL